MTFTKFILVLGSSLTIISKLYQLVKYFLGQSFKNYIGRKVKEADILRNKRNFQQKFNEKFIENAGKSSNYLSLNDSFKLKT